MFNNKDISADDLIKQTSAEREEAPIKQTPDNKFFGITFSNKLMVLGDQDSKVASPQGASPDSSSQSGHYPVSIVV